MRRQIKAMGETKENKGKQSSELEQILTQLSVDQVRFIVSRQGYLTDKEAAKSIGIRPNRISQWKYAGVPIDEAVRLMAADGLTIALHVRKRSVAKAMMVKVAGLDSEDGKLRQGVATEIIEWEMGKAAQPTDSQVSGEIVIRMTGNVRPEEL